MKQDLPLMGLSLERWGKRGGGESVQHASHTMTSSGVE